MLKLLEIGNENMFLNFILVFLGGGIGALLRFLATIFSNKIFLTSIYATFSVNIIGCFFIGAIFGFILNRADAISVATKLFLTVGLLGGLTTFSSFNIEVFELLKSGKILIGVAYLFASCFLSLVCTCFGYLIFSKI